MEEGAQERLQGTRAYVALLLVCVLAASTILIWVVILHRTPSNELHVSFLDVGQGDATLITAPSGMQVLIDAGANRSVLRALSRELPFWDRTIEVVIATHPDLDHIGGFPEVLSRYKVEYVLYHSDESASGVMEQMLSYAQREGIDTRVAERGTQLLLGGGVSLTILFPDRALSGVDPNDASLISQLRYGDTSFLFTGDTSKAIEEYLVLLDAEQLQSEVLKVGHHGSDTSTSALLLGYTDPKHAVISSGSDNRFGHPHEEVLDTLERFDVEVHRTDLEGTIRFTTDGTTVREK